MYYFYVAQYCLKAITMTVIAFEIMVNIQVLGLMVFELVVKALHKGSYRSYKKSFNMDLKTLKKLTHDFHCKIFGYSD